MTSNTFGLQIGSEDGQYTNYLSGGTDWIQPDPFNMSHDATPFPDYITVRQGMGVQIQYSNPLQVDLAVYDNCNFWFFHGINITMEICISDPYANHTIVAGIDTCILSLIDCGQHVYDYKCE
jgi:hypothetical protein